MHRFWALVLAICLITTGSPVRAFVDAPARSRSDPEWWYFENDEQLYRIDLADYRDNATPYAAGEGRFTVRVERLLFHDSPRRARFVFGGAPRASFTHLGSEARFVDSSKGSIGESTHLRLMQDGLAAPSCELRDDYWRQLWIMPIYHLSNLRGPQDARARRGTPDQDRPFAVSQITVLSIGQL